MRPGLIPPRSEFFDAARHVQHRCSVRDIIRQTSGYAFGIGVGSVGCTEAMEPEVCFVTIVFSFVSMTVLYERERGTCVEGNRPVCRSMEG